MTSGGKTDDEPAKTSKHIPRPLKPRIEPLRTDASNAAQKAYLEPLDREGRIYNIFTTLANHVDLARAWDKFAIHILRRNSLPERDRELVILRIGWLCRSEYEFSQHTRIGKRAGLTDDDIERIIAGPAAPQLSPHDRLLMQSVDELHEDACLSESTWNALARIYDTRQMMDLVFTVGQYNLVSMALNSFGVQLDPNLVEFPPLR